MNKKDNKMNFSGTNIDKRAALVTLMLVLLGVFIAVFIRGEGQSQAISNGFKHEPIQFEDFTFELLGSEYEDKQYTFHYEIVNTSNSSINADKTFLKIKNDKLLYTSELSNVETRKLNPGMSTTGEVVFKMNKEDLEKGSPIMQIEYGYLFSEEKEFKLTN